VIRGQRPEFRIPSTTAVLVIVVAVAVGVEVEVAAAVTEAPTTPASVTAAEHPMVLRIPTAGLTIPRQLQVLQTRRQAPPSPRTGRNTAAACQC
jgi:hypothetical protein